MLGICAFQDWRRREVSVTVLVLFGSIGLLFGVAVAQEPVAGLLSGMFPGGMLLALAWGSRGQIGMGDGWLILAAGCYLGFWSVLGVFSPGQYTGGSGGGHDAFSFSEGRKVTGCPLRPLCWSAMFLCLRWAERGRKMTKKNSYVYEPQTGICRNMAFGQLYRGGFLDYGDLHGDSALRDPLWIRAV